MNKKSALSGLLLLALLATGCFSAPYAKEVTLYLNYTDNMVLQRDKPVAISGLADPQKVVVVQLENGEDDEVYKNISNEQGEWRVVIPARPADGKTYILSVYGENKDKAIVCKNVVFGDIWICSGQSNMEMPILGHKFFQTNNSEEEIKNANQPGIRLFNATGERYTSIFDIQREPKAKNGWQVCTPESVKSFSALGYFFGRKLHQDLNVPIGLISVTWGGTPIQSWISLDAYQKNDRSNEINTIKSVQPFRDKAFLAAKYREKMTVLTVNFNLFRQRLDRQSSKEVEAAKNWREPDFVDDDWNEGVLVFESDVDGVMGFRYTLDLPETWAGRPLTLNLGQIDDVDETYFNGEKVGETSIDTEDFWQSSRVYDIPGKLVKAGKNVIFVRVFDFGNGGGLLGGPADFYVTDSTGNRIALNLEKWRSKVEYVLNAEQKRPKTAVDMKVKSPWTPSTLFNSMLAPWRDYTMRGMIWYQGCSNAGQLDYYELHKIFIEDVRAQRGEPNFPFMLVQLAGFGAHRPERRLAEDHWKRVSPTWNCPFALTREIQAQMLDLPMVGMAVALDIGDQFDIHPGNKQELGRRLALEAERIAYGHKVKSQGPVFDRAEIDGLDVRIYFKNALDGLATSDGKAVGALMLEYSDGTLMWTTGTINGDVLTVRANGELGSRPIAVAYGWCGFRGDVNLVNAEGLPALPFRSNCPNYQNLEKIKP